MVHGTFWFTTILQWITVMYVKKFAGGFQNGGGVKMGFKMGVEKHPLKHPLKYPGQNCVCGST